MQHLESFSVLEQRVQRAVNLISELKAAKQRLEAERSKLVEGREAAEKRAAALLAEKDELLQEGETYRKKQEEWRQYERDRDELRARIDGMLAKFEELEI